MKKSELIAKLFHIERELYFNKIQSLCSDDNNKNIFKKNIHNINEDILDLYEELTNIEDIPEDLFTENLIKSKILHFIELMKNIKTDLNC